MNEINDSTPFGSPVDNQDWKKKKGFGPTILLGSLLLGLVLVVTNSHRSSTSNVMANVGTRAQGGSICTYAPDYICYASGWPACCEGESVHPCPEEVSSCDLQGTSYCTFGPNYDCYTNGWPTCCDDSSCPTEEPPCDVTSFLDFVENSLLGDSNPEQGISYCTYAPDHTCYASGWPKCCGDHSIHCPKEEPSCDVSGTKYCTYAPNYDCYTRGWPTCCDDDSCPTEEPSCEVSSAAGASLLGDSNPHRPGSTPCTYAPDYACYADGYPACCKVDQGYHCPHTSPCDASSVVDEGTTYCTFAPDTGCYASGWPACCGDDSSSSDCPIEKPACESN